MDYAAIRKRLLDKELPKKADRETALRYLSDLEDGDQTIEMLEVAANNGDFSAAHVLIEISKEE